MTALLVGLCGAIGALVRFLVDTGVRRLWRTKIPVATASINLTGSFALGVVAAATTGDSTSALMIGVGFCGGYTTFSTAMVETVALIRERRMVAGTVMLLGQPVVCVLAAAGGYAIGA